MQRVPLGYAARATRTVSCGTGLIACALELRGSQRIIKDFTPLGSPIILVRSMAWFSGLPRAQTRRSAFVRLYDAA